MPVDASYSFRSLDRGPEGEAVILGTDGHLHVFDPVTAQRTAHVPAIGAWTEPDEWQSPMPNLHVQDGVAYVSDPGARRLVALDLADGSTIADTTLDAPDRRTDGRRGLTGRRRLTDWSRAANRSVRRHRCRQVDGVVDLQ